MATSTLNIPQRKREVIERAVIRFCGDSGDGMQITGSQFTNTVALYGNDSGHASRFPGRNSRPCGHAPGCQRFSGPFFIERRVHSRR